MLEGREILIHVPEGVPKRPHGLAYQTHVVLDLYEVRWLEEYQVRSGAILRDNGSVTGAEGWRTTLDALREEHELDERCAVVNGKRYYPTPGKRFRPAPRKARIAKYYGQLETVTASPGEGQVRADFRAPRGAWVTPDEEVLILYPLQDGQPPENLDVRSPVYEVWFTLPEPEE